MKRTNEEYLLLILSSFTGISIFTFALIRFGQSEHVIAIADLVMAIILVAVFVYVYKKRKITYPNIVLSVFTAVAVVTSIYIKGIDNVYWVYPALVAAYYLLPPKWAVVHTLITSSLLLPVFYKHFDSVTLVSVYVTIFLTSLFGFFFSKGVREQYQQLIEIATKDSLTGVGNRRALDEKLEEVFAMQSRKPSLVSLILLDLDHFKAINDEFGHVVGDQILIRVAEIIHDRIRVTDALYRFGGEEFVVVSLEVSLDSARSLAEQLRILIENNKLAPNKTVTVSLGVAEYKEGESSESWFHRADEALYKAKGNGRNQVCVAV